MTAMPATGTMTAEEYMALPVAEHGRPWNLVDGEVVVTDPTLGHQVIVGTLFAALARWSEEGGGVASIPIDVFVDDRNVYAPDVLWYSAGRVPTDPWSRPQAVPDLAVEVRSPSTWRHDLGPKKAGYERADARELWLVDTEGITVLVFRRSAPESATFDTTLELVTGDVLDSPLLPGFALPLDQLF